MSPKDMTLVPLEVITKIASQIDNGRDRVRFSLTCKAFFQGFAQSTWRSLHLDFNRPYCDSWAGQSANEQAAIQRINVDNWTSGLNLPTATINQCGPGSCRACVLRKKLSGAESWLATQKSKVSGNFQSLSFDGSFVEDKQVNATILRHTFLRVDGLAVLRPQAFAFNMHWKFWDLAILLGFQLSRLASLKIPIRSPSNCTLLGQALSHMSGLRSLTLTDLPDRPHFLRVFPRLGQGILARKASLRELDISMTNFNRPHYGWEGDEVMIKPEIVGYLFSQIFPISRSWIAARTQQRFADPRDSIHKDVESRWHGHGPLKLEKLRLRHVGIPAYAFRHILDASHLKELRIPYCDVAPEAWETLQSEAQLVVLENIDYELLPDTLVDFLQSQTSLESLSFSRPTNVYSFADLHQFSPNVFTMLMKMEREASWLGPGTAWGAQYTKMSWRAAFERCRGYYSTLDELMASLRHTSLKQLVLPADMYDISADFVSAVGCELKSLEYICWAFDYGSWEHRMAFMESFLPNVPHLRKITFLSLDRPSGLHDFDAPTFHQFIDSLGDLVPSTLKHIRYCHLSPRCYTGEFRESDVYYHRLTPVDGEWWLLVEGKEGEDLFKEGRTPQIVHVQ